MLLGCSKRRQSRRRCCCTLIMAAAINFQHDLAVNVILLPWRGAQRAGWSYTWRGAQRAGAPSLGGTQVVRRHLVPRPTA